MTIGTEGFTLPANTLLKEALQIINGVEPGVDCDMGMVELTTESYFIRLPVTKQRNNYFFSGIIYRMGIEYMLVPKTEKTQYMCLSKDARQIGVTIAKYADRIDLTFESYMHGGYVYYCAW